MGTTPASRPKPQLSDDNDADLLVYMTMAAEDPQSARLAWDIFYQRHVDYLYRVCLKAYSRVLGGEPAVADIVAEVFRLAYENAHKFDPAGITDPDRLTLRCRGWLGWIARRLVQDMLRGRGQIRTCNLEVDNWQQVAGDDEDACDSPESAARQQCVRQAIESLSPREQLVIRVTFQWYQPDRENQRLPNNVTAELAKTLETTPENLRQIRRRAMKKITDTLQAELGNDGQIPSTAIQGCEQAASRGGKLS